jgi:hypothetical protein
MTDVERIRDQVGRRVGGGERLRDHEVSRKDSPANGTSATMSIGISGPMGGW